MSTENVEKLVSEEETEAMKSLIETLQRENNAMKEQQQSSSAEELQLEMEKKRQEMEAMRVENVSLRATN